ncbi:MAG: YqzG/YhdC family protein [Alicyclobacillus sp.]|nr:YqzG/YhdC family protein [Alicyclobacillus sp.]
MIGWGWLITLGMGQAVGVTAPATIAQAPPAAAVSTLKATLATARRDGKPAVVLQSTSPPAGKEDAGKTTEDTFTWPVSGLRTQVQAPYAKPVPAYAKWGRVAVAAAKKRYPGASVIDYQHLGGETRPGGTAVERFKLWMRQGGREWGLWVDVVFQPRTQQVVAVHMRERQR